MNDDKDTPLNPVGDDALEARIAAWVLGEASSFEAAELENLCAADPALRLFERRLRVLHHLIGEDVTAGPDAEWQLPEDKRAKITGLLDEVVVLKADESAQSKVGVRYLRKPAAPRNTGRRALLALAACTVISLTAWSILGSAGVSQKRSVAVRSESPAMASLREKENRAKALEVLRKAIVVQEDAVEDQRKLLSQIIRTEGIVYSGDQSGFQGARGFTEADDADSAARAYVQLEQEKTQLQSQIETLLKYDGPQLMNYASGLSLPDNTVPHLLPQVQEAKREYDSLKSSGLSERHPSVVAKARELQSKEAAMSGAVADLRETLKAKLDVSNEQLNRLKVRMDSKESDAITKGIANQSFVDAKNDYEHNQRLLDELKIKLIEEEVRAKVSDGAIAMNTGKAAGRSTSLGRLSRDEVNERFEAHWRELSDPSISDSKKQAVFREYEELEKLKARFAENEVRENSSDRVIAMNDKSDFLSGGGGAGKDNSSPEPMSRARQYSPAPAEGESFALNAPQSPAGPPPPPAMPSRFPGLRGKIGALEEAPAKRPMGDLASRAADRPAAATAAPMDADASAASAGILIEPPATEPELAQNLTADSRNNVDAILNHPNSPAGEKAAGGSGGAMAWGSQEALGKSKADLAAVVPGQPGSADGFADDLDRDPVLAASKLAESRFKSETAEFSDLSRMGEWAGKLPAEGERQLALGGELFYKDSTLGASGDGSDRFTMRLGIERESGAADPFAASAGDDLKAAFAFAPAADSAGLGSEGANRFFQQAVPAQKERENLSLFSDDARGGMAKDLTELADVELKLPREDTPASGKPAVPNPEATEVPVKTEAKKQAALDLMAEITTAAEPFSTFSLHVSDASFKLAKAAMDRGEVPAADSIRPEEFYNAFDYGDPSPASGEPVVCAVEQSAHPAFPQRNLLRIGIKTGSQGRGQSTPLHLTLLLDSSGSMERDDRSAGLANAVRQLSGLLKGGDTITVLGFSRQPRLLADRLPGERAQELNGLIARTPSEGGTNLEEGLKLAEELAKRQFNPAAQNRVVLFTDGAANLGDARPEALQARVEGLRQQGIAFDAAGFGADGLNDKLLERMTRNGNGRYYIVDRAEDADAGFAKQLAGAFRPAAENVKVQVRFNPARVAKYKLIGFEEHRLQKEDFRNDAVDAAEMAAEEAGNALYQIEVLPQGEGEVGEVSTRFRDAASGQMVERTWTIPYEPQAPAFDQAKPAIQLAGLAAFAAEKLRGAPMADAIDLQQLAPVLAKVKARYPNSQPVADLVSMIGRLK